MRLYNGWNITTHHLFFLISSSSTSLTTLTYIFVFICFYFSFHSHILLLRFIIVFDFCVCFESKSESNTGKFTFFCWNHRSYWDLMIEVYLIFKIIFISLTFISESKTNFFFIHEGFNTKCLHNKHENKLGPSRNLECRARLTRYWNQQIAFQDHLPTIDHRQYWEKIGHCGLSANIVPGPSHNLLFTSRFDVASHLANATKVIGRGKPTSGRPLTSLSFIALFERYISTTEASRNRTR